MFRFKTIAIFALTIFSFAISFGTIVEANDPTVYGTVTFADDVGHNDSAVISVSGIAAGTYSASLVSSDGNSSFKLSDVDVDIATLQGVVQTTGSIDFTFDSSSSGYTGVDLLSSYSRFLLKNSANTYSASNDVSTTSAISTLVESFSSAKTSANALKNDLEAASAASTLEDIQSSVTDSGSEINNLKGAISDVSAATAEVKIVDESLDLSGVEAIINNINTWIASIEANNSAVSGTSSIAVAQTYVGNANGGSVADSHAILNGLPDKFEYNSDGNRVELPGAGGIHKGIAAAQGLASLSVIEGELPAAEGAVGQIDGKDVNTSVLGLGLPSVGDRFVTLTMQLSLIFGTLLILTSGGMILLKKK